MVASHVGSAAALIENEPDDPGFKVGREPAFQALFHGAHQYTLLRMEKCPLSRGKLSRIQAPSRF